MKATDQIEIKAFKIFIGKFKSFDEKHPWIDFFFAPFIVSVILMTVYAIKGVYPFGVNTVAYYDMPTNHVTGFSWVWDLYHGKVGRYLNWNEGLGAFAGISDAFFPVNLFYFFVSRENILNTLSFFLLIKLVLAALSMSFYFNKRYHSTFLTVCAAVMYSFSGYVLEYYTNIFFIDFVILLPLIVYALEKIINENKSLLFIILIFFLFMLNVQLVFMVCLYLIFKSYFMLKSVSDEDKGKKIRILTAAAVIGIMLVGFVIIPEYIQLPNSVRVADEEGFDYIKSMKNVYNYFRRLKHFIMYGSEISVGLLVLVIFRGKEKVKKYYSNIFMIIILGLPILHEGINLMWHLGSYKHFPVRFGYILTFECLVFVGDYLKNEEPLNIKIISRVAKLLGVAAIPFVAYVLYDSMKEYKVSGVGDLAPFVTYWITFLTLIGIYFIAFMIDSIPTRNFVLFTMVIIQASIGAYAFIAPDNAKDGNYRIEYVRNAVSLKDKIGDNDNKIKRIKGDPGDYDPNYPLITRQPSISYWSYGISQDLEQELTQFMGYDGISTAVGDYGGTVFTDAFLGVERLATSGKVDDKLYKNDTGLDGIYSCKYTMPFGVVFDQDTDEYENSKLFDHQNVLFNSLTGMDDKLIETVSANKISAEGRIMTTKETNDLTMLYVDNGPENMYDYSAVSNIISTANEDDLKDKVSSDEDGDEEQDGPNREYDLNIPINGLKAVYFTKDNSFNGTLSLVVNDEPVYTLSFMDPGSYNYPNTFRTGILFLGVYEDEEVNLKVYTSNKNLEGIVLGCLDLNILEEGIRRIDENQSLQIACSKSGMHVTGRINKEGTLLLPIGYSENWHMKINGQKAEIKPYINNAFISADVKEGDIDIELSYVPKGLILGVVLSCIGLVLVIGLIVFVNRGGISEWKYKPVIDKVFIYAYYAIVTILFIVMYVIPICIKMAL